MATRPNRVWMTFFLFIGRHRPQGLFQDRAPEGGPQLVKLLFQGIKIRLLADVSQLVVLRGGEGQVGFFGHGEGEGNSELLNYNPGA